MLGMAYEDLADRSVSKGVKLNDLKEAKTWFQKSLKTWERRPARGRKSAGIQRCGGTSAKGPRALHRQSRRPARPVTMPARVNEAPSLVTMPVGRGRGQAGSRSKSGNCVFVCGPTNRCMQGSASCGFLPLSATVSKKSACASNPIHITVTALRCRHGNSRVLWPHQNRKTPVTAVVVYCCSS